MAKSDCSNFTNLVKETIIYCIFGILTVFVNMAAFYLLDNCLQSMLWANTWAFVVAVMFAYWTNTKFVFRKAFTSKNFIQFWLMRIGTLVIDNIGMIVLVNLLANKMAAKLLINIIIILINYVCSKFIVFKQ